MPIVARDFCGPIRRRMSKEETFINRSQDKKPVRISRILLKKSALKILKFISDVRKKS